jgi:hypothetical protein
MQDEFVWHTHEKTDDFFLVLKGRVTIQLRDRSIELREGELFVVPRGVEHCPRADADAHVLLIEPVDEPNTGDAGGPAPRRRCGSDVSNRRSFDGRREAQLAGLRSSIVRSPHARLDASLPGRTLGDVVRRSGERED